MIEGIDRKNIEIRKADEMAETGYLAYTIKTLWTRTPCISGAIRGRGKNREGNSRGRGTSTTRISYNWPQLRFDNIRYFDADALTSLTPRHR